MPDTLSAGPLTGALRFNGRDGVALRFTHGRGGLIYTGDETPYVDFVLGMGPVSIGHANAAFNARLAEALGGGLMLPSFAPVHERYADLLLRDAPEARVVSFFKTGSEAVAAALRLAALETGRLGVVRCGYIGWHDAQLASTPNWNEPPHASGRRRLRHQRHLRGASGTEPVANWLDLDPTSLAAILDDAAYGAFIIDAYQIAIAPPDAIAQAIALCRRRGLVVILDETKTAGRRQCAGAYMGTPIAGDLTVLGKAIANGLPLSVLLQHRPFDAALAETRVGGTYAKECLSVHAALITAELMHEWRGYDRLAAIGRRVAATLQDALVRLELDQLTACVPLLGGCLFELRHAPALLEDRAARQALEQAFVDAGLLLFEGHCAFVCADHDRLDWDALARAIERALHAWRTWRHCRSD